MGTSKNPGNTGNRQNFDGRRRAVVRTSRAGVLSGSGSRTPISEGYVASTPRGTVNARVGARLELPRNADGTVNMRAVRAANTRNANKNKKKKK